MHPRYLFGPTVIMFGLIVCLAIGLWALGPRAKDPHEIRFDDLDFIDTDRATFETAFVNSYRDDIIAQSVGGLVVMGAVFALPLKRGPMFLIAKPALFILGACVTSFIRGAKEDSAQALFQLMVVGTIVIVVVSVISYLRRAFPDSKYPAHFRWSNPEGRVPVRPDDAATLARLERLRTVAAAGTPKPS